MTAVEPFRADPTPPERYSLSFLRAAEGCLRRAHHEREQNITGPDALVGRLFHEARAAIGFACVMRGQERPTVEDAVAITRRALAQPEEIQPLPREAWTTVLELVERWARRDTTTFRPGTLFEVTSRRPLAGRILSARIDQLCIDGELAEIVDAKTGYGDPAHGLTLQGEVYAWHVFETYPVEVVRYREEHVRFGVDAGPFEVTREDVYGPGGVVEYLLDAIHRIDAAYAEGGELPASPGDACSRFSRCPVASSCPVPKWARETTVIETRNDAVAEFEALLVEQQVIAARKDRIRGWLEHAGERALEVGGQEIGRASKPGSKFDKRALAADLAEDGHPVDLDAYSVPTNPTFGIRKASS